jgi:hypothetical protein
MMFGFVLGISAVIYGGFAIRRGDVDQGKMSIIGGAIIAAAPAVVYAFYTIFGLNTNSAVGVGNVLNRPTQSTRSAMSANSELRFTDTNAASDSKAAPGVWKAVSFGGSSAASASGIIVFFVLLVDAERVPRHVLSRGARAGLALPRLHLRVAAGQAARL